MNLIIPVSSLLQLLGTVHSTSHRSVDPVRYLSDRGWDVLASSTGTYSCERDGHEMSMREAVTLQQEIQRIAERKAMGL